jgi:hypothetical protein
MCTASIHGSNQILYRDWSSCSDLVGVSLKKMSMISPGSHCRQINWAGSQMTWIQFSFQ